MMSNPDIQRDYEVTPFHRLFSQYVADMRKCRSIFDEYGQALSMKMDNFLKGLPEREKWDIPATDFFYNCGAAMMKFGALPVSPIFHPDSLEPELSELRMRRATGLAKAKEKQTGVKQW